METDKNHFRLYSTEKRQKLIKEVENYLVFRFREYNWWTESQIAMLQEIYYLRRMVKNDNKPDRESSD